MIGFDQLLLVIKTRCLAYVTFNFPQKETLLLTNFRKDLIFIFMIAPNAHVCVLESQNNLLHQNEYN